MNQGIFTSLVIACLGNWVIKALDRRGGQVVLGKDEGLLRRSSGCWGCSLKFSEVLASQRLPEWIRGRMGAESCGSGLK